MKKLSLLLLLFCAGLIGKAQLLQDTFNICGYVSSTNPNNPAINATLGGYITQNNGSVLVQFSATTDSAGNFCTPFYTVTPDTNGCAYLTVNISANIPGCNTSTSFTASQWICSDTTIWVNINGCDTTSPPACADSIYQYTDSAGNVFLSTSASGTAPFTYQWYTNNQPYDTVVTISPNAFGQYCVYVTDASGCTSSDCYNYGQNNCNLSVALLLDSTPCTGPAHSLGSAVSGGTGPYSYSWSTGDSGQFICNLGIGQYCLTVTDANGCAASNCYYLQSSGNCSVAIYQYTDTTTGADYLYASFSGGNAITYQWTNGNGTIYDTTQYITPNAPGQYCVTVAGDSCSATACYYYGQNTTQCSIIFSSFADTANPATAYFYPYPTGTAPFVYYWSFSDGGTDTSENPVHTFAPGNGWDWACVQVTDASGCMSSYCDYVNTSGNGTFLSCYASFGNYFNNLNGGTPGEVFFTDYSYSPNQIVSWSWDFGDGTTSTVQNPSHIYSTANYYTICLTTTDASGCTGNYCETDYIDPAWWGTNPWGGNGNACSAGFVAMQDTTIPGMVYLVDISYGNYLYYTWTFTDSTGNTLQTINTQYPFISFNQFGCFNVCLSITDTVTGCQNSFCDSVCVDSLGNLNKATNWGLSVISTPIPQSLMSAKEEMKKLSSVTVFPNPTSSDLNLKISLAKSEMVMIELYDFTGKTITSSRVNFKEGAHNYRVDLSNYPAGVYFVKLNSDNLNHSEKVVKLH